MITFANYFKEIEKVSINHLPENLKQGHNYIDKATNKGTTPTPYQKSPVIRKVIDLYLKQLNEFLEDIKPKSTYNFKVDNKGKVSNTIKRSVSKSLPKRNPKPVTKKPVKSKTNFRVIKRNSEPVERISEEIKLIKRYVLLHEKNKNKQQIRLFINALQRAMIEKRIRKTSQHSKEIIEIQNSLIRLFGKFNGKEFIKVILAEETRSHLLNIVGKQELMLSVRFIKSYIGLQAKTIKNEQAKRLHNRIAEAINNNRINQKDPYWTEIQNLISNLKTFVKKNSDQGMLIIPTQELNGLRGIVKKCGCKSSLNGFQIADDEPVSSVDLVKMNFDKLGFHDRWLDFIGDPSKGFTAMVFGKPKFGKSTLCIQFAHYLAKYHGKVLYVAKEEKVGDTLQQKIIESGAIHPNLITIGSIPQDLSGWDFVFLDSVTKLGLSPEDLEMLKDENPQVSFIYIFQTTKQGAFRGENGYQHDVDVVIEVLEKGQAVQYGRFNQGGEMNIFN